MSLFTYTPIGWDIRLDVSAPEYCAKGLPLQTRTTMELVILSTALARVATYAVDRFVPEEPALEGLKGLFGIGKNENDNEESKSEEGKASETPHNATDGLSVAGDEERLTDKDTLTESEQANEVDDNSAEGLKMRIKQLRAEAAKLTSADTFMEYARKTREATRLEKQLREEFGDTEDDTIPGGIDVDRMSRVMKDVIAKHATKSAQRSFSMRLVAKIVVKILLLISLWYVFSYGRSYETRGHVMYVDCRALRPVSFLFRKRPVLCAENDWNCASQPKEECAVSYLVAVLISNSVIAFIVDGTIAKVLHR